MKTVNTCVGIIILVCVCDEVTQDYQCKVEKLILWIIFIYVKDLIYVKITIMYGIEIIKVIRYLMGNRMEIRLTVNLKELVYNKITI